MKRNTFYLTVILALSLISNHSIAQINLKEMVKNGVKIGDTVPDFSFENVVNYPGKKAKISDFRGKWLILDFWATWCGPCVAGLHKSDTIEQKLRNKVIFLPITRDKEATVLQAFSKMNGGRGVKIKSVTTTEKNTLDTNMTYYFQRGYASIPHYVWIDPSGVVKAITAILNEKDVEAMISGEISSLPLREKIRLNGRPKEAFSFHSVNADKVMSYAVLTGSNISTKGFSMTMNLIPDRIESINSSIVMLYRLAFSTALAPSDWFYPRLLTILESNHPSDFEPTKEMSERERYDHYYCFSYKFFENGQLKEFSKAEFDTEDYIVRKARSCKTFLNTLNENFPLRGTIEKRKMKCLVLKCFNSQLLSTNGEKSDYTSIGTEYLKIVNGTVKMLFTHLDGFINVPYVDETGINKNFDIELNTHLMDLGKLNSALAKYGLKFFEEERELDCLVLRDISETAKSK